MKYFTIILLLTAFLVAFVWQNIEVVKIKLEYAKMEDECLNLYKQSDFLKVKLERLRSIPNVEKNISGNTMYKRVTPADIDILRVE